MIRYFTFCFLYLYAFLLGMTWTTVGAIGTLLTSHSCENLSSAQYGSLSIALVLSAILSSILSGTVLLRHGMRKILLSGMFFLVLTNGLFFSSGYFSYSAFFNYLILMLAQFFLGAAIGTSLTALNVYIVSLTRSYKASLLIAFYACLGLGSAYAPLYFSQEMHPCQWQFKSLFLALLLLLLFLFFYRFLPWIVSQTKSFNWTKVKQTRVWIFALLPLLYGFIEEAFSIWGPVNLFKEAGWTAQSAEQGLTYFWTAVTAFQIVSAALCLRIAPRKIYLVLPVIIALAFYLFSQASSFVDQPWIFAFAGMGCSAFYSLTVHFGEKRFPNVIEVVSGTFVCGYMIGSGLSGIGIGISREYFHLSFRIVFTALIFFAFLMWFGSIYLTHSKKA